MSCASCGQANPRKYDIALDAYVCDERCHRDYCHDQFDAIYAEWAAENLEDSE